MHQLNLFSDHSCDYCGHGEPNPKNPLLWNGFLDQDTGQMVCRSCKSIHYIAKARDMNMLAEDGITIKAMTYSEMPVYNRKTENRIKEAGSDQPIG